MPRKDEIDRMIVLIYTSRNSQGYTNFTRRACWLDGLPMDGLEELVSLLTHMKEDVEREIHQRHVDDMPRYSRTWYESQEAERKAGADLLAQIGIKDDK